MEKEKQPWISVVTVCFNAEQAIEQTMRSVLNQTYPFIEYIIIDGASTDRTQNIIEQLVPLFQEKNYRLRYISEPDKGIYDAMNKGIGIASGEWINFMNAGDRFYDTNVINRIFKHQVSPECSVLYGDTIFDLDFGEIEMRPKPLDYLQKKMAFCHQSAFVRTREMKLRPFDMRYQLAADYDFFYYCYLQKKKFEYRAFPMAVFESEKGASSSNRLKVNREYAQIKGLDKSVVWQLKYAFKYISTKSKAAFYSCLPDSYVKGLRRKNYKRLQRRRLK